MRRGGLLPHVAPLELVSARLEIGRHAGAHGAQPDEPDLHTFSSSWTMRTPPLRVGLPCTAETRRILPRERRLDHAQCALPHLCRALRPPQAHHLGGVLRRLPPGPHDHGLLPVGPDQLHPDAAHRPPLHRPPRPTPPPPLP